MMGCSEETNLPPDSFNGRKLRPLVPHPPAANTTGRLHKADLLPFNSHLGMIDQSKRDLNSQQVVVTSRWNPTPEQLQTLEELYQQGTRTPSADQIQHITSQLRRYGKIEGKNVFYWFQNHKARERQKRRRQNESKPNGDQQQRPEMDNAQCKEPGMGANNKTDEIEHTKSRCWAHTSSSPTTLLLDPYQKRSTLALKAAAGGGEPECVREASDGWLRFHDRDKFSLHRNATWHMLHRRFANPTFTSPPAFTLNPSFTKTSPDQTLPLFPLRSGNGEESGEGDDGNDTCQFFEFLPLKN